LSICQATGIALNPERGWELDLNRLRDELRSNTKLISINFPNNPTGKVLETDIFNALVALCRERGLWLLSDEVFRLMERDSATRLPQAVDCYERGLSLNAMSKVYGLPGLRVGWVAARDRCLLQRMERAKHYLSICNSAPGEALAVMAIKVRDQIIARNRALIEANLKYIGEFFAESSELFEWTTPDGGMVGYPTYRGTDGVENFTRQALEEANVLFLPASIFHSELTPLPANRFRIGFGRSHVVAGLGVMGDWLTRRSRNSG
jgi:aspartate/methionine/tyrosine aminotransferase